MAFKEKSGGDNNRAKEQIRSKALMSIFIQTFSNLLSGANDLFNTVKKFPQRTAAALFILALLCGCNMPKQTVQAPTETAAEVTEIPPEPTETPTPLPKREKIAFLPSDELPAVTENLTGALAEVCTEAYECLTISSEDEIDDDTDFVIFAKEPTALSVLTQRFPGAQFILAAPPRTSHENAWVIQYDEAFLPFLAGLATTSNAYDWRSAGLIPNDSLLWGTHAEEAYLNGAHYFCGNCMPAQAPYVSFPLVIALPADSSPDSWSSQFDEAQKNFIYTAFLSGEAISDTLLQKLISLNVQLLGVTEPPAGAEGNWLASINFDWAETLRQIMLRSDAGEKQGTIAVILSITPGELTESFSEGKTNTLRRAYADLISGILSPYTPEKEYTE